MIMQLNHRILLDAIKTALTETNSLENPEVDYDELLLLSKKHQIIPLVFQGLYNAIGDFPENGKFYSYTIQLMCHDQKQVYSLEQLERIFTENQIDYMPLKGASIKTLYPAPEMRLMGDIDILIKEEQYPIIRELLSQSGFCEVKETDHELIWKSETGVCIELHKRLIPSYNDDYYAYYCDPWSKAVRKNGTCYHMTAEDEYIYIFTHLTKHYRDGGIGLRHVIDIWFFALKHPEMDFQYIACELDKLELKVFHQNILDTIDVWFNGKGDSELSDYLTERIVESGSFGIKQWCDVAHAARLSARASSVAAAQRKNVFQLIFMPYSGMKKKYPFLEKAPVLLPVMWVVRWGDALLHKRKNISREAERTNKINTQDVDRYTKELEMVGLKFNLEKD